jgi:hypothetical protein
MRINEQDLINAKALNSIVGKGNFEIKGAAVKSVAFLFSWLDDLENRIEIGLKETKIPLSVKEVKKPVEKIGK